MSDTRTRIHLVGASTDWVFLKSRMEPGAAVRAP